MRDAQVTIIGLGLMGGSLAGALKAATACRRVVGVARRAETAELAMERRWVDWAGTSLREALVDADVVVLATPVRTIIDLLPRVGRLVKPGCLVTDLGSTKKAILEAMSALPEQVMAVGGHPMCGKETSGLAAAEPGLYRGCLFVLSPLDRTGDAALSLARELVEALGARPLLLAPEEHDRLVAAVSHLPYLLACGLMATAEEMSPDSGLPWALAASGFRDTSRLAASDVAMMVDILLTNRTAVLEALAVYGAQLGKLADLLRAADEAALRTALQAARERRRRMFV